MAAWAAFAIASAVLIALSAWRLAHSERAIWWPGVVMFAIAALAMIVLATDWFGLAMFGAVILASDVVLLKSVLVASLCTREKTE